MSNLLFQPLIPTALWLALAVAAAALLAVYGWDSRSRMPRKRWLAMLALMSVSAALPLVVLLNPQWVERIPPPAGKPLLTILVDASRSMETRDAAGGKTRLAAANDIAAKLAETANSALDVEIQTFSGGATSDPATPSLQATATSFTDLGAAVSAALQPDRPQGQALLLLSDGIHNAGPVSSLLETAARAKAMSVPIFASTLGGDARVQDVAIEAVTPQELAFIGQRVPVRVRVAAHDLAGPATLMLWHGEQEVDRRPVVLVAGETLEEQFEISHDESGVFRYEARIDVLPQEVTAVNNVCTQVLRVVDEPIRILLLEGKPYWDTKFLIRTLAADQAIELVSLVRMAEGRFLERTLRRPHITAGGDQPGREQAVGDGGAGDGAAGENVAQAPVANSADAASAAPPPLERPEDWKIRGDGASVLVDAKALESYQVIVLGRDAEAFLSPDAILALRRWLNVSGGSLVCFRGPPTVEVNQQLAQLLPVRWSPGRETRFHMRLTESGEALRWLPDDGDAASEGALLARLPTLAKITQPKDLQPLTQVLAVAAGQAGSAPEPVVAFRPYASGRVVMVEGAGMWRWAFLSPEHKQYDPVYGALWHSLVRWLVSNTGLLSTQTRALRSDKIRFSTTEQATASLLLRESELSSELPTVELHGETLEEPRRLTPIAAGDDSGAFRVVFGNLPEGRYEARIAGSGPSETAARTVFDVRGNPVEVLELSANEPLLNRLATMTGGTLLTADTLSRAGEQINAQLTRNRPEQIRTTTAWDRPWVLAAMLGLWTLTWAVRRSSGLI